MRDNPRHRRERDDSLTLVGAAIRRITDLENRIEDEDSPVLRRVLRAEIKRRTAHLRAMVVVRAKHLGIDLSPPTEFDER